jgi:ribosomal protein S18 acetylase RimI-like enzyme
MIRQATPADAAPIARLIIHAMEDLAAKFVGQPDPIAAIPLFEHFAGLPANQYSYENILVYEEGSVICGIISGYDGAELDRLRTPFLNYISALYGFNEVPEAETQAGEYYIDCISVAENMRGKGIGKQLIDALAERLATTRHTRIGLLVSMENPDAERLYTRLGFRIVTERTFMGGRYYHMQRTIRS